MRTTKTIVRTTKTIVRTTKSIVRTHHIFFFAKSKCFETLHQKWSQESFCFHALCWLHLYCVTFDIFLIHHFFFQKCCFFILKLDDCPAEFKDDVSAWDHQKNPTLPPLDVMTDLSMAHFYLLASLMLRKATSKRTNSLGKCMRGSMLALLTSISQPSKKQEGHQSRILTVAEETQRLFTRSMSSFQNNMFSQHNAFMQHLARMHESSCKHWAFV